MDCPRGAALHVQRTERLKLYQAMKPPLLKKSDYPTYQTHDPKGWCGDPTRGAALGRHSYLGSSLFDGKFLLRGIRLDQGGYDCNGTYFGVGQPLFWFASPHEDGIDDVLRATNREDARQQILKRYPKAKFFR